MNSHGTGTAKNDPAETAATKVGLGEEAAYNTVVSSTKSMIGHLLGGAGAAEAIVVVKAIEDQVAPPTANFTEPDPECDLDYVPNDARELSIDFALSNNYAFGGANASRPVHAPGRARRGRPAKEVDEVVITGIARRSRRPAPTWTRSGAPTATGATARPSSTSVGRVDFTPATSSRRRSASAWTGSGCSP